MAHSLSAKKRIRQAERRRLKNRARKNTVKVQMKRLVKALEGRSPELPAEFRKAQEKIDRLAAKGVIHPNKAARMKSRWAHKIAQAAKAPAAPATGA
jgi:small subunit ribosomal protein S20